MTQPLTHARFGYRSIARLPGAVVDASASVAGYPARLAANPLTYEGWQVQAGEQWRILAPTSVTCNYVGLLHNLGSTRWRVSVIRDVSEVVAVHDIVDNSPLMLLFPASTGADWRLSFADVGAPTGIEPPDYVPLLLVAFIGQALAMSRPIYGGHTPSSLARESVRRPNLSESGQYLGQSKIRRGESVNFDFDNLDPDWYREHVDPFAQYLSEGDGAFFAQWRPQRFPDEAFFGWATSDLAPSNTGRAGLMSASLSARGYAAADPEDDFA